MTGCNIFFAFFNQDKYKFWNWCTESQAEEALTTFFMELSEKPHALTEEQISITERFTGFVYYGQCINSTDSERMRDFQCSLHGDLWLIPSSRSGLKEHLRRAVYWAGCVNFQYVEYVSLALLIGAGDLVMDCFCLSDIQVKLILTQIL